MVIHHHHMTKLQASELPIGAIKSSQTRRKASKLAPLVALTILLTIPLYYPSIRDSSSSSSKKISDIKAFDQSTNDDSNEPTTVDRSDPLIQIDNRENPNDDNRPVIAATDQQHGSSTASSSRKIRHKKGREKRPRRPQKIVNEDTPPPKNTVVKAQPVSTDRASILRSKLLDKDKCDLFSGEWVPDPYGPYYTNDTCNAIQEHQNCMKFQRPDLGFLKWRWKPDDCGLPLFDADAFLELVRGKSLAFVGDSVARNHMQSLVCLLSKVTYPVDLSDPIDQNRRYEYRDYNFNISMFWSPYLVRTERVDPNDEKRPFKLFLDEPDTHWTAQVPEFDYVIMSAGHWFFRPTYFYLNKTLTGCLYCPEQGIPHLTSYFSYRRAFRTSFRALRSSGSEGVVFLRSFAPSHFEGAQWDKGGDCVRTRPFMRNETRLEDYSLDMYMIQLEELEIARRGDRFRFKLFDATKAMMLRPDGHPSRFGHWQVPNQTFANDCVHWCLPGPIDAWNDLLLELLRRETS